jgi:hypothetical protein
VTSRICAAALQASPAEREERGARVAEARQAIQAYPMPAVLKHLLANHFGDEGMRAVAPPLVGLTPAQQAAVGEAAARLKLFDAG